MGSPKKRRRRRAAASTLSISPDASGVFSAKEIAQMGSGEFMLNAMRHSLRSEGKALAPFLDGAGPDQAAIDAMLADSGMVARGLTKLSDLDLTGIARIDVSKGGAPANHTNLVIGSATFHFTNQGGGTEDTGTILPSDHATAPNAVAVQLAADGSQGAQLIAAMGAAAVKAAHPDIASITVTADVAAGETNDADVLYMETSKFVDIAVSKANDGGGKLEIENIAGRQHAMSVNHYYMDISANAEDRTIEADSGVLWLENGPGAKYIHGVNAAVAGAATVDILPASMDAPADQGRRMIFKVVSGVFAGDQIKVEAATHADGNTVAAPDALSDDYNVLASISDKADLDPAHSTNINLGQHVLAADSNEGDDSNEHFGLKVTFDRVDAAANLGMGAGLAIAWRVVGS